jgi:hypothetical protein
MFPKEISFCFPEAVCGLRVARREEPAARHRLVQQGADGRRAHLSEIRVGQVSEKNLIFWNIFYDKKLTTNQC